MTVVPNVLPSSRKALVFSSPEVAEVIEEAMPPAKDGELVVHFTRSAVSVGSERLVLSGGMAQGAALDESFGGYEAEVRFPLRYGYAAAGQVIASGSPDFEQYIGKRVFCFHPHATYGVVATERVLGIPPKCPDERAVLLAQAETSIGLVHDLAPRFGERIAVWGAGTVGLFTGLILNELGLEIIVVERDASRRQLAASRGLKVVDPSDCPKDLDGLIDATGSPQALSHALRHLAHEGTAVVGSWFGDSSDGVNLGTDFHRRRLRLISSQVSNIAAGLSPRWTKKRRFDLAWDVLERLRPDEWLVTAVNFDSAPSVYGAPLAADVVQPVFVYDDQ